MRKNYLIQVKIEDKIIILLNYNKIVFTNNY